MKHRLNVFLCSMDGMRVLTSSSGKRDNLAFWTIVTVSTLDNSTSVIYRLQAFEGTPEAIKEEFTDYTKAVDRYNELVSLMG